MSGWEGRNIGVPQIFLLIFVVKITAYQPLFKDLPSHVLLHHISVSRQLPLCILLRKEGTGSKLENVLHRLWKERDTFHNISSWEVGSYTINQESGAVVQSPASFPCLRCYLGETIAYDYEGKASTSHLTSWFQKLYSRHYAHQQDVTQDVVEMAIKTHSFTIIAFPNMHIHKEVEEIVHQISYENTDHIKALVVHPHSEQRRVLQEVFGVDALPAAVVVHKPGDDSEPSVKIFPEIKLRKLNIETYIEAQRVPTTHFNAKSFADLVLDTSRDEYIPYIIGFHAFWAPNVLTFLKFFSLTVEEFEHLGAAFRFGLVNLSEERSLVSRFIDPTEILATSFPFILLFTKDQQTNKPKQTLLREKRPSPYAVYSELQSLGVDVLTSTGRPLVYRPYGLDKSTQISALFEGPHGVMCSVWYHNLTDNTPIIRQVFKKKIKKIKKKNDWPNREYPFSAKWSAVNTLLSTQHVFDEIDASLPKNDGIPVVSHVTWGQVIEKSHAPRHPFASEGKWAGEYTKVAMIVFLIDGCGSCRRNWHVFKQLHRAVKYVDGGAFYIANCTVDPEVCVQHGVTGFPTILAFRGFGWLGNTGCVSELSEKELALSIRLDYHGVILEKTVMEWFSSISSPAVSNLKFEHPPVLDNTKEDIRLVGTLMPKYSRFLPKSLQDTPEVFYPYQCYRLACERLYGQAKCYTVYNSQVPVAEFEEDDLDIVVIKVRLERRDGVQVAITQIGRYLRQTISEEHGPHLHTFHKPHRYNLGHSQKCEDDHSACTDLITSFTRDHARLPVTHLTAMSFHTKNNPLFEDNLPVLLSLVHEDNITTAAGFLKILTEVGTRLYKDLAVVTVDVDLYPDWVSKFVPAGYAKKTSVESDVPELFHYPRLCIVQPSDHHHAAFYPPVDSHVSTNDFTFTLQGVMGFVQNFLKDPHSYLIQTEHF